MAFQYFIFSLVIAITNQATASTANASQLKLLQKKSPCSSLTGVAEDGSSSLQNKFTKTLKFVNVKISTKRQGFRRKREADSSPFTCNNLTSCAGRCSAKRMYHNIEENKNSRACYCDKECDKVFSDCCADYVENCGRPKKIRAKKIHKDWKCFPMKDFPFKIWMIAGCRPDWPRNDSNFKYCAKFSAKKPKASWITPVLARQTTYRNRYCALCNGVKKFKTWTLGDSCKAPKRYTKAEKMEHYDKYCDVSKVSFNSQTRGIRYCYKVVKRCKYFGDKDAHKDCVKGTTGLLSSGFNTYRNYGCVLCNRKTSDSDRYEVTCGPGVFDENVKMGDIVTLTTILGQDHKDSVRNPGETLSYPTCPLNQIYDNAAKSCRKLFVHNATTTNNFLKQFQIRLVFQQTKSDSCSTEQVRNENTSNYIRKNFAIALRKNFNLYLAKTHQNTSIQWRFHDLQVYINENNSNILVTFQILRARSVNETINSSFFREELKIEEVDMNFLSSEQVAVNCSYFLTRVETREAVCLDNQTYPVDMKDLESENGSIYINRTQNEYKSGEYLLYQYQNETRIAVCRDAKPYHCLHHLHVRNRTHWTEYSNRSIYSLVTKSWFHYGDYSLVNGTLWLCLIKNYTRQNLQRTLYKSRSIHDIILSYGSISSFSVSIASLTLLLLVYSMFPALRNLPGKNLMLFSAILALAQTTWLLQNRITSHWPGLCPTINAVMQYLFLASFTCSLSIAIQSFLTFRALVKGKLRQRSNGASFLRYAIFSLGLPFLFVVICWILDTNELVPFNYGTSNGHCWFASTNILYIAFLYPAFLLLLCNMSLFFATLRVIYKCTKASQKLAEKTSGANKKHVGIYLRMSTIMGFTWLFAVFNIFFPHEIVFKYTFVFVNGFQGLYLSFAFLSTANVKKIISGKGKASSAKYSDTTIKRETSTNM